MSINLGVLDMKGVSFPTGLYKVNYYYNINTCLPFLKYLDHFINDDFIFGLGNFDLACVGLKAV